MNAFIHVRHVQVHRVWQMAKNKMGKWRYVHLTHEGSYTWESLRVITVKRNPMTVRVFSWDPKSHTSISTLHCSTLTVQCTNLAMLLSLTRNTRRLTEASSLLCVFVPARWTSPVSPTVPSGFSPAAPSPSGASWPAADTAGGGGIKLRPVAVIL